jgi:hypothetical protein
MTSSCLDYIRTLWEKFPQTICNRRSTRMIEPFVVDYACLEQVRPTKRAMFAELCRLAAAALAGVAVAVVLLLIH